MFGRAPARAEAKFANLGVMAGASSRVLSGATPFQSTPIQLKRQPHFGARDSAIPGTGKRRSLRTPRDAERPTVDYRPSDLSDRSGSVLKSILVQ